MEQNSCGCKMEKSKWKENSKDLLKAVNGQIRRKNPMTPPLQLTPPPQKKKEAETLDPVHLGITAKVQFTPSTVRN